MSSEDLLIEADERYRSLIESLPMVTYVARRTDRTRLTYMSPQIESMTGFAADEWLGDSDLWRRRVHPDDLERVIVEARSRFLGEEARGTDLEYRLLSRDGEVVWVHDQGTFRRMDEADGIVVEGVIQDVTALRRAQLELEQATALHRATFQAMSEGIIVVDDARKTLAVNSAAERIVGMSAEEFSRSDWWEQLAPRLASGEGISIANGFGAQVLQTGDPILGAHLSFTDRAGEERQLSVNYEALRDGEDSPPHGLVMSFRDITDERAAQQEILASKERYEAQFRGLPVPTYAWQRRGDDLILIDSNDAGRAISDEGITAMFGITADELYADDPEIRLDLERCYSTGRTSTRDMRYRMRSTGEEKDLVVTHVFIPPDIVLTHTLDVTERVASEGKLRHLAEHDSLTGLFNRHRFEALLEKQVAAADGAVVLIDIDHFKFVNDSLGHSAGDELLRSVAAKLDDSVRPGDSVARLGGDEFAVLLADVDEVSAQSVAGHLLKAARSTAAAVAVTVSAGIAAYKAGSLKNPLDALVAADIALYQAKEAGRDRVAVFGGKPGETLTWIDRVRAAIDDERLALHAQPIIDLTTSEPVMEELLVRMIDEDGRVISPASFLPIAEQFGLIREIDRWVIRKGVERAATGRRVSINLSARSLSDTDLPKEIKTMLRESSVSPGQVGFEYTETAAVSSVEDARKFTEGLLDVGCDVALDDFGTGFGSFVLLKHLPISTLKIDIEFVRGLSSSEADRRIVRSIVHIAAEASLKVVAEGVEDEGALALLRDYGVDYAQGYFIGRPEPISV